MNALEQTILVCIDEAQQLHKWTAKFKSFISENVTTLEVKGLQPICINNFAHFLLATNVENPFKIEGDNRRYGVFKVSSEHKGDTAYYTELNAWLEAPGHERAFFDMLMARDLTGVNLQASLPKTDEYKKIQLLNTPAIVEFLVDQYEDGHEETELVISRAIFQERFMLWARRSNRTAALNFSARYLTTQFEMFGFGEGPKGNGSRTFSITWEVVKSKIMEAYPGVPLFGA